MADDYTEDCCVQVKDFVNEPIYDVVGDDFSSTKRASDGNAKIGVKDDGDDVVFFSVGYNDDYFNTRDVDDNDKALANKISDLNVFVAVVEDCDSHDDPSQNEGANFDVTKVEDLVDNDKVDVFDPVHEGCDEPDQTHRYSWFKGCYTINFH